MERARDLWNTEEMNNSKVCVMDASGTLGAALVQSLIQRGYTVNAATLKNDVYDDDDCYNKTPPSVSDQLRVFHCDPLDYHSILDALRGCCGLFYSFDNNTYDEWNGELEVRAAHNVLEACAQTHTIDKVVFTSSATAVIWRDNHNDSHDRVDERNWSDINFCKKYKLWHGVSKTVSEKTAWALAKDRGVNMVSINAGLLTVPDLSIKDPYLLGAEEMFKDGVFVTVDLKFLVDAHICVFEDVSSYGRYLCFNRILHSNKHVVNLANMLLPSSTPSYALNLEDNRVYQKRISNEKLSKLMMEFDSGRPTDSSTV